MTEYNGWKNRETWNVALWFNNDEALYNASKRFDSYKALAAEIIETTGKTQTPDGVAWLDSGLDYEALDKAVIENHA